MVMIFRVPLFKIFGVHLINTFQNNPILNPNPKPYLAFKGPPKRPSNLTNLRHQSYNLGSPSPHPQPYQGQSKVQGLGFRV